MYWEGVDEDWKETLKPFILVCLIVFSIDVVLSIASVCAYAFYFIRGSAAERKTMSFNFVMSIMVMNMSLLLWIFILIGWLTGGIGVSAYVSEILLCIGWSNGIFLVVPTALRWMKITAQFVNTPFAQFASKWSKSGLVRIIVVVDTSIVVLACGVCSIMSAIPDEATADLDPAFQTFPYYMTAVTIQASIFGAQCFINSIVILAMGRTMFSIISLTTEASSQIESHGGTTSLGVRKRILLTLKVQTVIVLLSCLVYIMNCCTDWYYSIDLENNEKSKVALLISYVSGILSIGTAIPVLLVATYLDLRMHSLRSSSSGSSRNTSAQPVSLTHSEGLKTGSESRNKYETNGEKNSSTVSVNEHSITEDHPHTSDISQNNIPTLSSEVETIEKTQKNEVSEP